MKIPPSTIYITVLILIGILKQIPYHNLKYTLKHWFVSPQKLNFDLDDLLSKTSEYYAYLTPYDQEIFRKRVMKFIFLKRFIPAEGMIKVIPEMKVLIAQLKCLKF